MVELYVAVALFSAAVSLAIVGLVRRLRANEAYRKNGSGPAARLSNAEKEARDSSVALEKALADPSDDYGNAVDRVVREGRRRSGLD